MGLRVYPWLQDARREQKRDYPTQPMFLNCTTCRENNSEATREAMGCGWMALEYDEDEDGTILPPPSVWKHPQDQSEPPLICPGYTTMLPDVIDVSRAYAHYESSNLGAVFPDGMCPALTDGLSELHTSIKVFLNKPAEKS